MRRNTVEKHDSAVQCSNCGKGAGTKDDNGNLHCNNCGDFAAEIDGYCVKHSTDYSRLTGYDHCPKCAEQRRVNQARQENAVVGHNMHPTVDAPRR